MRRARLLLTLLICFSLTACQPGGAPDAATPTVQTVFSTGAQVNLAQVGQLAGTVALEIAQFSALAAEVDPDNRYTLVTTIVDRETLNRFVQLLDQELDVGMVPACIADFELRFQRADGVVVTFGYQCQSDNAEFIRTEASDGSLSVQGEVKLPDEFRQLVNARLDAAAPAPSPVATELPAAAPTATGR